MIWDYINDLVGVEGFHNKLANIQIKMMEMLSVCVIIGSVLGVYFFVRKLNEVWYLVKLGRRVYKSLPSGDLGWPLIGSSFSFYKAFKAGGDPDSFIHHLISRYISSSLFHFLLPFDYSSPV